MNILTILSYSFLLLPIAALLLNNLLPGKAARRGAIGIGIAVVFIQLCAALVNFVLLAASGEEEFVFSLLWDISAPGVGYFRINLISLFLLFCIGLVALISVLTAGQTIRDKRCTYLNLLMALLLGMDGMVLVADLFSLYVFLEITGIASFVLIAMFKSNEGLEGAFKYLSMSALATIFILAGLAFLFFENGSLAYADLSLSVFAGSGSDTVLSYLALILLIAGFAIKTGAAPFHSWLPDAHQSADTSVSILLSGIVIKIAGIYSLVVLTQIFAGVQAVSLTLAVIGCVSIVAGALLALRQTHFKRIVAYSSVSQMGYILLGLACGSPLGLVGALFHVFNHATFKSTLFSNAAALHEQLDTLDINEMGGLQARMPITSFSSVCAFLSTAGIPPFAGFWSKLLIMMALWNAGYPAFAGIALVASIFTAAYFLRLQKKVFFGKLNEKWAQVREIRGAIRFNEILLTVINIAVGLGFPLILRYLQSIGIL